MSTHQLARFAENAPAATYGGTTAAVAFWGLHISEICVLISTVVSVMGLGLQIWLALHRIRRLERHQGTTDKVVGAVAQSHRVLDQKVETIAKTGE